MPDRDIVGRAGASLRGTLQLSEPCRLVQETWQDRVVPPVQTLLDELALLVVGLPALTGPPRALVAAAALLYFAGVQAPTVVVNIPLDNEVQELALSELETGEASVARERFETRWNRWNVIRTLIAVVTFVLLLNALGEPSPPILRS